MPGPKKHGPDPEWDHVLTALSGLPSEHDGKYETEIVRLVEHGGTRLAEVLCAILDQDALPPGHEHRGDLRFAAYVALAIHVQRMKGSFFHWQVLNRYRSEFTNHVLFNHIESLLLKSQRRYLESLELAERAVKQLPDHPGVLHNFAETVALVRENQLPVDDESVARARQYIRQAIQFTPDCAEFYCTEGRLAALDGHFDKALELINRAIAEESTDCRDYAIRLAKYQAHVTNVHLRQAAHKLDQQAAAAHQQLAEVRDAFQALRQKVDESLQELRRQNLKIIGFFTVVLSLTLGSIQILAKQNFQDAASLIIALGGMLLTVYSGFILAIGGMQHSKKQLAALMSLGMLMMTGVEWLHHFIQF